MYETLQPKEVILELDIKIISFDTQTNFVRISPQIDWYHYQSANGTDMAIVRHQIKTGPKLTKHHINAHWRGGAIKLVLGHIE